MHYLQKRRYETFHRVLVFARTHSDLFPNGGVSRELFDVIHAKTASITCRRRTRMETVSSGFVGRRDPESNIAGQRGRVYYHAFPRFGSKRKYRFTRC